MYVAKLGDSLGLNGCKSKLTHKEVVLIDSRFVPFMEEVEDDENQVQSVG